MNLTTILRSAKAVLSSSSISQATATPQVSRKSRAFTSTLLVLSFVFSLLRIESGWGQISLPYSENFGSISAANGFPVVTGGAWTRTATTTIQPTYIANQTTYNRVGRNDTKFMSFRYNAGSNVYCVGPFNLTAGVSYTVGNWYITDGLSGWTTFKLTYGTGTTVALQPNTIASVSSQTNSTYNQLTGAFIPATTGSYYIGMCMTSTSAPWYFSVDDFSINLTPPPPTITSIFPLSGCPGSSITITGTNLTGAISANVKVGGTPVSSIPSNTGTSLVAVVGAGTSGPVSVTTSSTATSSQTFTVSSAPAAPVASAAASITSTSALASWVTSSGATSYRLDVATDAAFTAMVSGFNDLNVGNVTSYSLFGLTANTTYYYRVRGNNGSCSGVSSSTISFFTGYCIPTSSSVTTYFTNFSTSNGVTNISNSSGATTGGYVNYSSTQSTSNYPGYNVGFSATIVGGTAGIAVFVDWNEDLDFADVGETVYSSNAYMATGTTSGIFVIPAGTTAGNKRMRIVTNYNSTNPISCSSSITGESEDYMLSVIALPVCSGTPVVGDATVWSPEAVSGFNTDVIANGVGSASSSATQVDLGGYAFVSADFQAVAGNAAPTYSLPLNGIVNSVANTGVRYQMGSYSSNNSLRLTTTATTGTLTLGTGSTAKRISVLVTSGSGTSIFSAQVNFSDGTNQQFTGNNVSDWYGSSYAIAPIGRVKLADNALEGSATQPGLYDVILNLSLANQSKTISSISFTKTDLVASALNIFGLSLQTNAPNAVVCNGQTRILSLPDLNTVATGLQFQWQTSSSSTGPWANITGATGSTYTTPLLTSPGIVYYRCNVTCINSASAAPSTPVAITVNPVLSVSPSTGSVCSGSSLQALPSSNSTYLWSNNATTSSISVTSAGTYSVLISNNGCVSKPSATVTLLSAPSVTSTGSVNAICTSSSAQSSTFSYSASTNSPTSYSIDWNAAANTAGLADVSATAHTFLAGGGSFTVPIGANVVPGIYNGTLSFTNANGCNGTLSINVTVTAIPTLAGVTQTSNLCFNSTIGSTNASIQLSGLLVSTAQTATYSINGGTSQTIAFTSTTSGTATLAIPVIIANHGQTLSITSINCANFTTNNSCVLTIIQVPTAPSVSPATLTVNVGASATFTASLINSSNSLRWWNASTAGNQLDADVTTPGLDDAVFNSYQAQVSPPVPNPTPSPNVAFCAPSTTYTYYVEEFDAISGCPSTRTPIVITTNPLFSNTPSNLLICQAGGSVTLQANVTPLATQSFQWLSSTTGTPAPNSFASGSSTSSIYTAAPSVTTNYALSTNLTPFGCSTPLNTSQMFAVGVLNAFNFTPTADPSSVCINGTTLLQSNVSTGNFSAECITSNPLKVPPVGVTPTILCSAGIANITTSGGGLDDGYWNARSIGFNYNFFGTSSSTFNIGTNGTINFGANGTTNYSFPNGFPSTLSPQFTIAACARDLQLASVGGNFSYGTGTIRHWTEGIAPTRRCVIQYIDCATWYSTNANDGKSTVEVILYETTGIVDINVITATNPAATTGTFINDTRNKYIGLQGSGNPGTGATAPNCLVGNTTAQANYWNGVQNEITAAAPKAWRFTPGANYTYQWYLGSNTSIPLSGATSATYTTTTGQSATAGQKTYTVAATNPTTQCASTQPVQITVNPTPSAPNVTSTTQCGPGVPTATLSSGNGVSTPAFTWYTQMPTIANNLLPLSTYYSNDFTNDIGTGILSGDAALGNNFVRLTNNATSLLGGFTIPASGINSDRYNIKFDIQSPQASGADGISYSFADDADAVSATPNAEHGTGSKLVISFDEYGTAGTAGSPGIRVIYGGSVSDPLESGGTVLAFSPNTSWSGSASFIPVEVNINQTGVLSLTLNGSALFSNIQLPSSYLTAAKGTWKHVFKARTGGVSAAHRVDNVIVQHSAANSTLNQTVSATSTYYVTESVLGCPSAAVPVTVTVNPLPATLTPTTPAPYCQGDPASPLTTTGVTGANPLNWYLGSLSATPSTVAPTPTTSTAGTTNYLVTQTSTANGCASTPATITIVVNATPSAPAYSNTYSTGTITQCQGTSPISISNAVVASVGGTLYYYTVPTGGTALSSTPSSTSSVAGTTTYYVSQVISGCEGPRTAVTSVVNPSLTPAVAISASSTTVCPGGSITYNAVPTNGGPAPTYVWFVNTAQVGTGSTYTQVTPVSGDAIYATMVSNEPSCLFTPNATSSTITLNNSSVTPSVSIIQNTNTTICANSSVTFSVANALNMGATPTYAWKVNGTTVGTAATYTTTTLTNNAVVTLTMTSSLPSNCLTGGIASANAAGITITITPVTAITSQPSNANVCLGGAQSLAVSAIGTGTITYQWQSASTVAGPFTNISFASNSSAQSATLSIPSVGGQLSYQLVATSACGSATSSIATISINQATTITAQPQAIVACEGTSATLSVTAIGTGTISYQWRKDGSPITGATAATYTIPTLNLVSSPGQYSVVVSATCGSVTSNNAQLSVNQLTTITTQPIVYDSICEGSSLSLSISASGTAPISYQWRLNGTPITGATSAIYTNPTALVSESGLYTVVVSGACSNVTSSATSVVISPNTAITTQPVSYTGCALNPTSLSVSGVGANVQYQWSIGSNPATPIIGATSATYSLSNPQTSNSGTYSVTLTGVCGSQTSNPTLVTINPVPSAGTINGGNSGVCVGSTINLTNLASGGVWTSSNPAFGSISSTGVLTGVSAGTITVTYTVTNSFGCVSTATKVIQVKGIPTALIQTPLATSICQGESMNLQSSAAVSYAWSNGGTTQNIAVNSSATGTVNYTVTVTGTNQCTATSAPVAITVIPVPTIGAITGTGNFPNFCLGNTSNLSNATANGIWSSSNTNVLTVNPLSGSANTLTIGTATVSYYVANIPGCLNPNPGTATATITVSTPPAAFITSSGSTTFCQGGNVTLTAPTGVGYNYLWSTGATTQSIVVSTSGSYSLTVTATGGCSVTSLPTTVNVLPIPSATIYPTGAINICSGTNVTLSTGSAVSYVWSNGAITPTISVNTSGSYSVTLTGTNGCTVTSALSTVTVTPVPSAVITANGPTNICDGGSVGLSVPAAQSYLWSNGATTQAITATSTGNYSVTATNGICSTTSTPTYVNFNPVPSSTVTASGPTTFCQGGNVTLTAPAGNSFTYLWSNGATTQSITVAASGTHSVTVSNSFNCSSTSTPITVVVNALPIASITAGGSTTICSGNSLSLTAASANAYLWSTGATTQSINASNSGNYTVQAFSAAGCTATSSVVALNVLPSPTAVITQASGTTFCQGGSVVINSTPASAYLWSNNETTQAISATTSGVYSVLVTAANGCTATSNTINVTVLPTPTAVIYPGTNVNICAGSTVTLSTGTAASYTWSNGANTPTITVGTNSTHTVTLVGSNGCTATSALTTVTVNPIPVATITASGTTNICSGTSVNLTAPTAGSYLWSNGATTQSIVASLAGAYTVTVTTAGCSATSASTTVNVNQSPTANVTASGPTSFCQGGSVSFTANAGNGYTYLWNNGETTATISTSISGNNTVTVTNLIGCSTTSAVNAVVVNPIPSATITAGGSTTICSGTPVSLSAPAGGSYLWNTGATTQSINAANAGNYTVTVSTLAGCTATSSPTTISVNALPSAAITSNGSTTFCQGGTVGLTANNGMSAYLWSNGATGQTISAGNSGAYTVVVTDANGCSATSNLINVTVNPAPNATIFPGTNVTICSGSSVTLSTNSAVSYAWSNGSNTPTIQVNGAGTYSVTLTGSNGCSATSPMTIVAVTTTPTAAITSSGPTTICQGDNVSLSAPPAANSYLWNTGATTQTITVSLVGSYFVTVGSNGCSATSPSTFVSYNPVPSAAVSASGPTTFCQGNDVTFSAPAGNGNSYLWNTGATTQTVNTATAGNFSVTVTNGYGCSASSTISTVVVNPLPVVTPITGSSSICAGTQGQVSNVMTGGVYASSNLGTASIGQLNGQISGLTAGTTTISYLYTDNNGCSNTVTYPVTIIAAPVATITAGGPTTFCQGGSVVLTASSGTAYAWNTGATTASITATTAGSYSVTVTGANGCSASSQATTVNVLTPSPVSAINGASAVCVNSATTLTNATSGGTWSSSNPLIASVSSTGNVTGVSAGSATITYAINSTNGCQNAATKLMTVNSVPSTALTASGATTFCQGGNVQLTASTGATYVWSNGATTSAITATTAGTYNVTVTNANGCSSVSTNQTITVNANPTAQISTNGSTNLCTGGSITLMATPSASYLWSNGATTSSITTSTAGAYTVSVTNANGCSATSAATTVVVNASPSATVTAAGPTSICSGNSVVLTATAGTGNTYQWTKNGVLISGATSNTYSASTSGSYAVIVTNASGCTVTSVATPVSVILASVANITASGSTSLCNNASVTLTATSGASYLWSNGATTQAITVNTASNYTVTVTNASGCSATSVATPVIVNASPAATITAGGPTTFCQGGNVVLTASAGATYLWSNGATTSTITATTPGTYSVLITNASGCSATSAGSTITVNAAPVATITASGNTTFCSGGSVTLTASSGASYLWSTGATTASISATTAGARTVTVTNAAGCSSTSTATTIVVNAMPTATITAGGATTICSGSNVTLTASTGSSYLWNNGATTASIVANTSGNYTVTVFNANGCSAISTPTTVTVNNPSVANIATSGSTTFCTGGSVVLTATTASSYAWSTGATTQAITVSATGNYSVTLTNAAGCTSTSPVTVVTANSLPTATITAAGPTTFCQGGSVTLTASAGTSYVWSNGATTASVNITTPGSYTVQLSNSTGCTATSIATVVTVNALPTASITASGNTNLCAGASVTLTASAGSTYLWSTGATTPSIVVTTAGARTVTVTNAAGCSTTSSPTNIVVNALPTPSVTSVGSTTICQGATVTLTTANGTGLTYQWQNNGTNIPGATAASYIANAVGSYTVQATNAAGCIGTSSATAVVVNALPVASISNSGSNTICSGSSVNLTANGGTTYAWNNGATTATIAANATGNYTVSVTNAAGCTSTASTAITVITPTVASISANGPTSFCTGQNVVLTANAGASYLWSTGATTASITVAATNSVSVQVTYASGCVSTSPVTVVTANALPAATITASGATSFCPGSTVTLTASNGSTYAWTNGATTSSIVVSAAGNYGVTVGNAAGCSATSALTPVVVFATPTATITPSAATTFCQGASINLTANAGAGYAWSNGASTSSISVSNSGNFTVTVTDVNGCTAVSSLVPVTVNAVPVASIQVVGPTTVCQGTPVVLTANGGTGFTWSNNETTSSISVTTTGSYGVTVSNAAGCSSVVTPVSITVNPVQVLSPIVGASDVCVGASTTYTNSTSGGVWSSDNTAVATVNSANGNVSGISTGSAIIKYQFVNASGCTSEVTKVITVNGIQPISIAASGSINFCQGGTVTLSAPAGLNYNWTNGATTQSITVNTSGNYGITATNVAGCSTTSSIVAVTVNPLPLANITSSSTTLCQGSNLVLNAPANAVSYAWSNGATTQNIIINAPGNYSLTMTDANGCSASASTTIVNGINPQASISAGGATTFCQGGNVVLNAAGGTSFLWNNGATTQSISVTTPGNYSVMVTNVAGCSAMSNSTMVNVLQAPNAVATAYGATTFCQGGSVIIATSGGTTYTWSNGSTAQSITPITSGTYSVIVTGSNGCTATSNAINVTVNPTPTAVITPSGATTFCEGSSVNLVATGGATYAWNNGSTNATLAVTAGGTYTVTVTNAGGCTDTETMTVTVNEVPSAFIVTSGATTFCQGGEVSLTAQTGNTYVWSNNATTQSISVSTPGTYSATILSPNGCSVTSNAITVTVNQPSASNLIATAFDSYTLNGILYTQSGTFTQTLTNAAGCDSTITLELTLTVGIEEGTITDVNVYPNPTSESFTIKTSIPLYGIYSVVDAQGKLVFEGEMTGTDTSVNISNVARGIYYLRIPELSEPLRVVKN